MGPSPPRRPVTQTGTEYYMDPQGNLFQRQADGSPRPPAHQQRPAQVYQQQLERQRPPSLQPQRPAAQQPPAGSQQRSGLQPQRPSPQQARASEPQPEYRYFRRPDGTVVRQRASPAPRPGGSTPPKPLKTRPTTVRAGGPRWTPKRIAKHLAVIAIVALLLLYPTTIPWLQSLWSTITTGQPTLQPFPESAEFTLLRKNTLSSTGPITWRINISKPFHIKGIHELKSLTPEPTPSMYEYKGQEWMHWEGSIPSGGGSANLRITYKMKLYSTLWEIDESYSGTVADISDEYDKYLVDEWKITPSDPEVKALSEKIVGGETNVYKILLKIYNWMDDNLKYQTQRDAEPKSCTQTLADRNGDCDDQSILLASLARAAGVPVWLNLGIIYDPIRDYWGGHGWNNVFIPKKNSDKYVVATVDIVNNQFLFRDPYHVSDYIDNGNGKDLEDYYTSWSYTYSTLPWQPPPVVSSQEDYKIIDIDISGSVIYTAP